MRRAQDAPPPGAGPRGVARSAAPADGKAQPARGWSAYLVDPRSAVLAFLAVAFVLGGGRKGLQALRARRLVAALGGSNPSIPDVEAAAEHGRAALVDLFRLLAEADRPEVRAAAGRALAELWRGDELIAEEEKAVVRRGFAAVWRVRRTYPRGLRVPIAVAVDFGVPFLRADGRGVGPAHLAWSYRITGAERARLEQWTDPAPGPIAARFEVYPDDFTTLGPHRLVLQARARTVGLTDTWELDLPHLPCTFEFDPHLTVDALLAQPDDARAARWASSVRLAPPAPDQAPPPKPGGVRDDDFAGQAPPLPDAGPPATAAPIPLTADLLLRDPPELAVDLPLPCDLAHRVAVEFEGIAGTWDAGVVVAVAADLPGPAPARFPLGPIAPLPPGLLDRPGPRRVRAILTADAGLGWVHPAVRSVWPGSITTDWMDVRIIRR